MEAGDRGSARPPRGADQPLSRTVKDSVFCDLFSQPRYALELYRTLHPEDDVAREEDVHIVTLQNVLVAGQYNDLGFTVGDRLLVMVEAQSSWSPNIVFRSLLYTAQTLKDWAFEHRLDLYGGTPIAAPRPELYVVYTGRRDGVPDVLTLSDALYGGVPTDLEATVHVLSGEGDDIVGQYVDFAHTADDCRRDFGYTEQAARETVRECVGRGVLADYLRERENEVVSIMSLLYLQEEIVRMHDAAVEREIRERATAEGLAAGHAAGLAAGRAEGRAEGRAGLLESAASLVRDGIISAQEAAMRFGLTDEEALQLS